LWRSCAGDADPNQSDTNIHFIARFSIGWNENIITTRMMCWSSLAQDQIDPMHDYFKGLIPGGWRFRFIFKSASNIHFMQNTASVCLLPCVCSARERNLSRFGPRHHGLDVAGFCQLFARIRRSDRCIRLSDQSLVARDGSKIEAFVATGLWPVFSNCLALNGQKRPTGPWPSYAESTGSRGIATS